MGSLKKNKKKQGENDRRTHQRPSPAHHHPRTRSSIPQCDVALAYWNFFLALFSTLGALRIVPHLLWFSATHTFKDTVCTPPQMMNGDGASGLWCLLFTLSKVIELLDTMFVCLKGRTPSFLHWYAWKEGGRE